MVQVQLSCGSLRIQRYRTVGTGNETSISEYMMSQDAESSPAKSAAPAGISDHATIKVFTSSGYRVVHEGDNGFVCVAKRGFTGVSALYAPSGPHSDCV